MVLLHNKLVLIFFFFFQAEDGIRDVAVTGVQTCALPICFPGLLELPLGGSVYELLEEHFGAEPDEAVERIEVVLASPDEAAILDVEPGAPLMAITRTTTDPDGDPIEFSRDLFRADRTRIVVRTEGGGSSRGVPGRARVVELQAQEAV